MTSDDTPGAGPALPEPAPNPVLLPPGQRVLVSDQAAFALAGELVAAANAQPYDSDAVAGFMRQARRGAPPDMARHCRVFADRIGVTYTIEQVTPMQRDTGRRGRPFWGHHLSVRLLELPPDADPVAAYPHPSVLETLMLWLGWQHPRVQSPHTILFAGGPLLNVLQPLDCEDYARGLPQLLARQNATPGKQPGKPAAPAAYDGEWRR